MLGAQLGTRQARSLPGGADAQCGLGVWGIQQPNISTRQTPTPGTSKQDARPPGSPQGGEACSLGLGSGRVPHVQSDTSLALSPPPPDRAMVRRLHASRGSWAGWLFRGAQGRQGLVLLLVRAHSPMRSILVTSRTSGTLVVAVWGGEDTSEPSSSPCPPAPPCPSATPPHRPADSPPVPPTLSAVTINAAG